MSLRSDLVDAQKEALKQKNEATLGTLRMLWSAIRNAEIDNGHKEFSDEEVQKVVSTQIKQLKDACLEFEKGGRSDLIEKANQEIKVLQSYLPEQLSDEELEKTIKKIIDESNLKDLQAVGRLTGLVMKEVKGRADGNRVKDFITKLLAS